MRRLFIAEKNEVGEAIARVLGETGRGDGFIQCGDDTITWCSGHMLRLFDLEEYNEAYKEWKIEPLPIVPRPWRRKVIDGRAKQLNNIGRLIGEAETIVHAGDTDDEGQLLVDEVLQHFDVKKPVLRVLINDNNPKIVRRAIDSMKPNSDFYSLSQSAEARSVADQLYGFNFTRLYTLKAREKGLKGVFSVGRVQTPILGLVVNRDRAVSAFKKGFYYPVIGSFAIEGKCFDAKLKPGENAPVDDKGNIIDLAYANSIADKCKSAPATVKNYKRAEKLVPAPLPYDLLELQVDASRKYGLDPDRVKEITQDLRTKHELITYNRADCRYLSEEQHADAPNVLAAIAQNAAPLAKACGGANPELKSRAFDSSKVTAHHGIIPTETVKDISTLSDVEQKIYLLIARAYIAQFFPLRVLDQINVVVDCCGEEFSASQSAVVSEGWKKLYANDLDNQEIEDEQAEDSTAGDIAGLGTGDAGVCSDAKATQKETAPPKPYTMATLLKDLKRVAIYVKNPEIAKALREKDKGKAGENGGIGTPATRDSFITKLIERTYITKSGNNIVSTPVGRDYHDALPEFSTQPDLTALWHLQQKEIQQGQLTIHDFIDGLVKMMTEHITEVKNSDIGMKAPEGQQCPACKKNSLFRIKGSKGFFWGCKDRENCGKTVPDKNGKPDLSVKAPVAQSEHVCGACGSKLVRRIREAVRATKTKKAKPAVPWYGCSNFPTCKQTYFEKDGKPDYEGAQKSA
jgi:DNA topoisomerase-3